jgi:hypothetical protein
LRATLSINDALIDKARSLTNETDLSALVHEGPKALIERESAKRLARLGGSEPDLAPVSRRRLGHER